MWLLYDRTGKLVGKVAAFQEAEDWNAANPGGLIVWDSLGIPHDQLHIED